MTSFEGRVNFTTTDSKQIHKQVTSTSDEVKARRRPALRYVDFDLEIQTFVIETHEQNIKFI